MVSEHGLRSLKLRVRYTDLFLTTLKTFIRTGLGQTALLLCPTGGFNDEPFLLLLYHMYVCGGEGFPLGVFLLNTLQISFCLSGKDFLKTYLI